MSAFRGVGVEVEQVVEARLAGVHLGEHPSGSGPSSFALCVRATGNESAESNREMFLFQRTGNDGWKIARYMFNKPE